MDTGSSRPPPEAKDTGSSRPPPEAKERHGGVQHSWAHRGPPQRRNARIGEVTLLMSPGPWQPPVRCCIWR